MIAATSSHDKRNIPPLQSSDTFVFGDIHGQLGAFLGNLTAAGLIDPQGNWCGQQKHVIQVGDLIDRGPHSLEVMLYLRALQKQARIAGGKVVRLLGNHEMYLLDHGVPCASNRELHLKKVYHREVAAVLREVMRQDIGKGDFLMWYADSQKNIMASHSEISKELLLQVLEAVLKQKNEGLPGSRAKKSPVVPKFMLSWNKKVSR